MNRQTLPQLHALAVIGACVLVSGCARFSGTLPSEYQRSSGTISFVEMQEVPGLEGVSDEELLERLSRAEAQRTRTDLPQLRRLSVEDARTELEEFWIPTKLPHGFDLSRAEVIVTRFQAVPGYVVPADALPPSLLLVGADGSVLTIKAAPLPEDGINIPVGPRATLAVEVLPDVSGTIVNGHWHVRVNQERTDARTGWDADGAKRLLFTHSDRLFEIDIAPSVALSNSQLLSLGRSLERVN